MYSNKLCIRGYIFENLEQNYIKQEKSLRIQQHIIAIGIVQYEDILVVQSLKWDEQVLFHVSDFDLLI